MNSTDSDRPGLPWLEIFVVVATIALLFQLFPWMGSKLLWAADVRNWSNAMLLVAVAIVALIIMLIRFGPDIAESQRAKAASRARGQALVEKQRQAVEARQRRQGIEDGRKRTIY